MGVSVEETAASGLPDAQPSLRDETGRAPPRSAPGRRSLPGVGVRAVRVDGTRAARDRPPKDINDDARTLDPLEIRSSGAVLSS